MAQITEQFAADMLGRAERGLHPQFTVWEAKQLLLAWQEREALRKDAERLDWMSQREARVGWNREGDLCRVWVRNDDEDDMRFDPVCGWDKFFNTHREAIDAAMQAERDLAAA